MGTIANWVLGTTTTAQATTAANALINAANTVGQYSQGASVALTTTPSAVPFTINDTQAGGISHSTTTNTARFTATAAGIFTFVIQPQATHLTTGTGDCTFWLRKNGTTPVANSAAKFRENGALGTATILIVSPVALVANDYIEVMAVASAASEYELTYTAASGSGATAIPNTPSIICTVTALPA